jgi:hypothetical protein
VPACTSWRRGGRRRRRREVVRLEPAPLRAAELEGLTEASQDERAGGSRKKGCPLGPWLAEDPAMLPCVNVPDLARFDWPAVRLAGNLLITRCQRWA